jgi:Tol biopolymer transport system component
MDRRAPDPLSEGAGTMKTLPRIVFLCLVLTAAQLACQWPTPSTPAQSTSTPAVSPTFTPTPTSIPTPHGQIAYGSGQPGSNSYIVLMDLDSGTATNLTGGFAGAYYRPVFSPDGNRLAMREEISMSGGGIAVMNVSLAGGRPVGSPPSELYHGFSDSPTWSPGGASVAFIASAEGGWTAYYRDLEGGAPARLPGIPQHATDLAWSPDGSYIAFANYENSSRQIRDIYIIHTDGTGLRNLTNTPDADEDGPAWSPDGTQIAFSGRDRSGGTVGVRNIYRMNAADGSGVTRVTDDPAGAMDPAWSPDGTQIAFSSTRHDASDGNYEIYVIDADGTGETRLTNNRETDRWPTWRNTPAGTDFSACRAAGLFVADVTIPAGTQFPAAHEFSKVWRIRNTGNCGWATNYGFRFAGGEAMGGAALVPLSGAIQSGDTVDVALPLSAPAAPGAHSGSWVLYDGNGRPVPGPDGNPFTLSVQIEVLPTGSPVLPASLYFRSRRSGSYQVWRMETDGATVTQVTNEPGDVDAFDASPADGTIAYVSQRQLLLVNRDGTNRRVVADLGEGCAGYPAWSADGSRLAYASNGIRIYNPATGEDRLLIPNHGGDAPPSEIAIYSPVEWSPDGTKLLVSIGLYESSEMGILSSADGSVLARLPSGMHAWRNDSQAVFAASAYYPMISGMEPGLRQITAAGADTALIGNAFIWWPFHRPDNQLAFFVSRPAGMDVSEYSVRMSASAVDGSGEHALRSLPLLLDSRDGFTARWTADGQAVAARLDYGGSGVTEILLIPAGDGPPVFLMQEGSNLQWEH